MHPSCKVGIRASLRRSQRLRKLRAIGRGHMQRVRGRTQLHDALGIAAYRCLVHTAANQGPRVRGSKGPSGKFFDHLAWTLGPSDPWTLMRRTTMSYGGFSTLSVSVDRGVAWVTIDHP